jgi:hypothetical protein
LKRAITEDLFNTSSSWDDIYPPTMSRKSYVQLQAFIDGRDFIPEKDKVATEAVTNPHALGHSVIGGDVCPNPLPFKPRLEGKELLTY